MKIHSHSLAGIISLVLLAAACKDPSKVDTSNATTTGAGPATTVVPNYNSSGDNTTTTNGAAMNGNTPATNGTANTTAGTTMLSDAQILEVTHYANAGELAQAKLANDKTKDPRVKKLADMMLKDHGDADKKGADIAKKENIMLADSPTSMDLKTDADKNTTDLQSKSGADFDKAYVDTQVKEHQAVLDTLDNKLIPAAKDADVKSYLTDVRKSVAMHLDHAKQLQADLGRK